MGISAILGDDRPADVLVVRSLHTENGQSLKGLLGAVSAYEDGGRLVVAQRAHKECEGGAQRVRTYWTDGLRGVEAADLEAVTVELADGQTAQPIAFEDHRLTAQES